jgi:hypothetical protein
MATVTVAPMPLRWREISARLRPQCPPVFGAEPSASDVELARELVRALDPESRDWYAHNMPVLFGDL